jgi:hypothetical protein
MKACAARLDDAFGAHREWLVSVIAELDPPNPTAISMRLDKHLWKIGHTVLE